MRMTLFLSIMHTFSKISSYFLWEVWCNRLCCLDCVVKVYRCSTSISLWHDRRYYRWVSEVRKNYCLRVSRVLLFGHHWVFWGWVLTSSYCRWYLVFASQDRRAWISGMLGSIDCMHWRWHNCPVGWQSQFIQGTSNIIQSFLKMLLLMIVRSDMFFWSRQF
jgi:hypothetical protein